MVWHIISFWMPFKLNCGYLDLFNIECCLIGSSYILLGCYFCWYKFLKLFFCNFRSFFSEGLMGRSIIGVHWQMCIFLMIFSLYSNRKTIMTSLFVKLFELYLREALPQFSVCLFGYRCKMGGPAARYISLVWTYGLGFSILISLCGWTLGLGYSTEMMLYGLLYGILVYIRKDFLLVNFPCSFVMFIK